MRNSIKKLAVLVAALGAVSAAYGYEFRAPLTSERGPLRYIFEERDPDTYRLQLWSSAHSREAYKAFMSHGFDSKALSAVIFNEEEFRLSKIFPDCRVPLNTEFYNPFMRVLKFRPRVSYHERGTTVGGRVDFPVWENKGRIGVRATVPFRQIEMERDDRENRDQEETQDVVLREVAALPKRRVSDGLVTVQQAERARAYRFDLVEALPQNIELQTMIEYDGDADTPPVSGQTTIANQRVSTTKFVNLGSVIGDATITPAAIMVTSKEGLQPRNKIGIIIEPGAYQANLSKLPASLVSDTTSTDHFAFEDGVAYDGLSDDNNHNIIATVAQRVALQDLKAQWWVSTVHDGSGAISAINGGGSQQVLTKIEDALNQYNENPEEWMADRGMLFETSNVMGIGDIDLDLFYEHYFSDELVAELMLGVRLPTGSGSKFDKNTYRAPLGNGEHWEIKLGAMLAWQAVDWMGLKLDAYWSFVLEGTERRAAAFKGALVKNIGPGVDAEVDWGYFVGRLDFNFTYLDDKNLHTLLGYEFYYKTSDDVHFKQQSVQTWLGRKRTVVRGSEGTPTSTGSIIFSDNPQELDNSGLERNTEALAHRFRWETSYSFSRHVDFFVGGSWTFAGQNIAREVDCHGGFVTKF